MERTWLDACNHFAEARGCLPEALEALAAFRAPWPRGGAAPPPERPFDGDFEALEARVLAGSGLDVAGLIAAEVDGGQARMFERRLRAVDRLEAELDRPEARLLRVGLRVRLEGIRAAPPPRSLRVRALADFHHRPATRRRSGRCTPGCWSSPAGPRTPDPVPSPRRGGPMAQVACSRCGTFEDEKSCFYSEQGDLLCPKCQELGTVEAIDKKATNSVISAAIGSFVCGFLGFCCNPVFLVTVVGFFAAIGAITGYRHQQPEWKQRNVWVLVFPIIALVFLVLQVLFGLLGIVGFVLNEF